MGHSLKYIEAFANTYYDFRPTTFGKRKVLQRLGNIFFTFIALHMLSVVPIYYYSKQIPR